MRRVAVVMCAFAIALVGVSGFARAQAADVPSEAWPAANCQHTAGTGLVLAAAHVKGSDGANIATIQLCKDANSPQYWAFLYFYSPLMETWGNAYLYRYVDGQRAGFVHCDSPGGSGHAMWGKSWCWTPKIDGSDPQVTFQASAIVCAGEFPSCDPLVAYGEGPRMR